MVSCGQRGIFVSGEVVNCCGEGVKLIDREGQQVKYQAESVTIQTMSYALRGVVKITKMLQQS